MMIKCGTLKLTGAFTALSFLVSCSTPSPTKNLLSADYLANNENRQVTFMGTNDHPRFNDLGTKILFQSSERSDHKGSQIYEGDLIQNTERRITFSDGNAFDADYVNTREIIYSSSTDEIKETPLLDSNSEGLKTPSELYLSDIFGTKILRLTDRPGYDAQPIFFEKLGTFSLIYTSQLMDKRSAVFRLEFPKLSVRLIAARKGISNSSPAVSPDRTQLAWIQTDLETRLQSLVIYDLHNKTSQILTSDQGSYSDLSFAPRSPLRLFYGMLRKGETKSQIEVYDIQKKCTQVVLKGKDSLSSPAVSDVFPEKLAFVSQIQDRKQIYVTRLPTNLGPCLEPPAPATMTE